jgi:hypothetical protein
MPPAEMTDDEECDEEALARLADSVQSEGGRSRKRVSWNTVSQERRSGSLDLTSRQTFPSRRSIRTSLQMSDAREAESDIRGRSQQRGVDSDDDWGGTENHTTPTSRRPSRSRADRRSASLVFLGFWALFGVGTLVGNHHSLSSTPAITIGRVLTPVDGQAARAFDPPNVIRSDYEPEGFSWTKVLAEAGSTAHEDLPPSEESPSLEQVIGRMSAWTCTTLYLTSRLPQIWKNVSTMIYVMVLHLDGLYQFARKSVEGLSMYLFVFAFLGNTFYVSSLLTSPKLDLPGPEASAYIRESIPWVSAIQSCHHPHLILHKVYPGECWDTHV